MYYDSLYSNRFVHMLSVCRLIEVGKLESAQTSGYYPAGQV